MRIVLITLLIIAACLTGQLEPDSLKVFHGDSVVVEAEGLSLTSAVLHIDEVRLSGPQNLALGLRKLGNLNVITGNKGITELRIRGFRAEDIALSIDGAPANGGYYGRADFSFIDDLAVEKIIVHRGTVGDNSAWSGGGVDIISRKPSQNLAPTAEFVYGDGGFLKTTAGIANTFGDFGLDVAGAYTKRDYIALSDDFVPTEVEDGGAQANTDFERISTSAALGWNPSPEIDILSRFTCRGGNRGIPSATDHARYWRFVDWRSTRLSVTGEFDFLRVTTFIDDYFDRLIEYNTADFNADSIRYDSRMGNFSNGFSMSMSGLRFGNAPIVVSTGCLLQQDFFRRKSDTGADWDYRRIVYLNYDLGIRSNYFAGVTFGALGSVSYFTLLYDERQIVDPNGALFFETQGKGALPAVRFEISSSVRYPTPNELYCPYRGNLELKPQSSIKTDLGIVGHAFVDYSVNIFGYEIQNYIFSNGKFIPYENLSPSNHAGVEIDVSRVFSLDGFAITLDAGTYYIDVVRGDETTLANIPQVKLLGGLAIDREHQPSLGVDLYRYMNRYDAENASMPDYTIVDANAIYRLPISRIDIEISTGVNNLLDTNYEEETGYPAPGRTFFGALRFGAPKNP